MSSPAQQSEERREVCKHDWRYILRASETGGYYKCSTCGQVQADPSTPTETREPESARVSAKGREPQPERLPAPVISFLVDVANHARGWMRDEAKKLLRNYEVEP